MRSVKVFVGLIIFHNKWVYRFPKILGTTSTCWAPEGCHRARSILMTQTSGVTSELHCYLAF
jgi:hypothetical protein